MAYNEADHPRTSDGKYANKYGATSPTELPTTTTVEDTEELLQDIIDEYGLDYCNGELYHSPNSTEIDMTMEAPNNATMTTEIPAGVTRKEALETISDQLDNFDANEEFAELWSPDFGEHNSFTPSQFMSMLQEDETYFHDTARQMRAELRTGEFNGTAEAHTSKPADDDNDSDIQPLDITVDDTATAEDTFEDIRDSLDVYGEPDPYKGGCTIYFQGDSSNCPSVDVPDDASLNTKLSAMADALESFDVDEAFEVYYDRHNVNASDLLSDLEKDNRSYRDAARQLRLTALKLDREGRAK